MDLDRRYAPSPDVVVREIEGEVIIVPIAAGIGDLEDEIFTLNPAARAVFDLLDGDRTLRDVVRVLSERFESGAGEIESDVAGLTEELARRKILVVREPA